MCRSVASELEKISQGVFSGPLTSVLKVMPLALVFTMGQPFTSSNVSRNGCAG